MKRHENKLGDEQLMKNIFFNAPFCCAIYGHIHFMQRSQVETRKQFSIKSHYEFKFFDFVAWEKRLLKMFL